MGKKTSRQTTKVGSAASPATGLSQSTKSSILRAAFSPSEYQLALFASVIQGLDAQHLRIHDTNTGRLQCEHALGPKETITSLDWGYYSGQGKSRDQSKKKRKRGSDVNGVDGLDQGDVVVAFGTSTSEIRMFSPSEDKIVGTLTGTHEKGIKDFKFTAGRPAQEAWSIGGDNKLVQWDLRTGKSVRTIHLPAASIFTALSRPVPSNVPVICASQTPYLIDMEESDEEPVKFPAMRNQIHSIISTSAESAGSGAFLASDGDRFINVFDASTQKLIRNLVAEQNVSSVSLHNGTPEKQILAAITEDGTIELFTKPFAQAAQSGSAKANRKQMTQKANASLKIVRSDSSNACVPVVSTLFHGHEIVVAYAEGGVIPVFERVKFLDETTDELAFTGTKAVVKTKTSSTISSVSTNGVKNAGESRVDDTHATVQSGMIVDDDVDMNDIQDDVSISGDEDSDVEDTTKPTEKKTKSSKPAPVDEDVEMQSAESEGEEEEEEGVEPSFGELLRRNAGHEVDVEAELEDDLNLGTLVPGKPAAAVQQIPTGVSLATVLTQSLKTNDKDMLESCFHTSDITIIRSTIQRLESSLAATLLQKLAERLSSRPGRYGHLLAWVQWVCVAHGGALAGHPDLLKRVSTLYKVMDQRSSSLSSLLLLKGKLDMLEAQLGLRRDIHSGGDGMDSEDEDNVIYVEGHEDDSDSDAEGQAKPRTKSIREQAFDEDESMMNGIVDESEDEEDDSEEEDEDEAEGVLDIEAEESAGSSDAEESLEENEDEDSDEASEGSLADFIADTEDEGSDDAIEPAPKKSKPSGKKGKLGKK
ncbi:hypothetical protein N7520_000779 [Penicillium odoratum]|uniref:uncharacterized protein n=1 Tax=Penicillium odoratum TaxID=1167516 RepID=UPI0025479729|nr:uncharacterized protein N7520_000779 [Penicillium odoratum]KAJ5777533.1 hypothetical protein N7520_000779 [Penicillium odoratum]